MKTRRWLVAEPDRQLIDLFNREAGLHPVVSQVLVNRGIVSVEEARRFINPGAQQLHSPFLLDGVGAATDRIEKALAAGETILIFGDYDVDGITSTSLLYLAFRSLGASVGYFVPTRLEDGYGLSANAARKLIALPGSERPSLVITVDCGISSFAGIEVLNQAGIDVVVTDHHEPADRLPDARAVINPNLASCSYPFKYLAGVGVAMKLATAVFERLGRTLPELNDIVALGTIADVMPLKGENRTYVKLGLEKLSSGERPGIVALKRVAGYEGKEVGAGVVGFQLAPRINAAGRLGRGDIGVRLLTTDSVDEAMKLATVLDEQNKKRQEIEDSILREARGEVLKKYAGDGRGAIVIASTRWHQGVIGIVASRLAEEFYRPTVLISLANGMGKGSARSIPAFHLFDGLAACRPILEEMGGHKYAAGLTIREDRVDLLRDELNRIVRGTLRDEDFVPQVKIDAVLNPDDISMELLKALQMLTPYGAGNPEPVFCLAGSGVVNPRIVGKNHLKLYLHNDNYRFEAIGFRLGDHARPLSIRGNGAVDAAFTLQENSWNGNRGLQLSLKDIRRHNEVARVE